MRDNKFLIVFDTNILYIEYKKTGDFTTFYFNSTFKNIIDKIEELDVYEHIEVAIPSVVWEEMKEQKISSYYTKLNEVNDKVKKFKFPFHNFISANDDTKYESYLEDEVAIYKEKINKRQVKTRELNLPTSNRFESIINRAFKKKPPFEAKEGIADKGFKDALLWESILELKEQNKNCSILLYTNDKIFNESLKTEYADLFEGEEIKIFRPNEENLLIKEIETIAKSIDEYAYIPEVADENQHMNEWFYSDHFKTQFQKYIHLLKVINKYISFSNIEVINIFDILECEEIEQFASEIQVEVTFDVKGGTQIKDTYEMTVWIHMTDESTFMIDNINIEQVGEEDEYV